jgi:hypothetical protein
LSAPQAPYPDGRLDLSCLAFSSDGRYLVAGGAFEAIVVWNLGTGKVHRRIEFRHREIGGDTNLSHLAFSPDGKLLAGGGYHPNACLFDVPAGAAIGELEGHGGSIHALQFSADGRSLLTGSSDTSALLWDLTGLTPRERKQLSKLDAAGVGRLCDELASRDGKTANRAVRFLAAIPERSLPLLKQRLRPTTAPDPNQVKQFLAELDSDDFKTRRAAFESLERLTDRIEPALRDHLKGKMSLEARRQVERLCQAAEFDQTPDCLFAARAVEALEWMRTTAAEEYLEQLARGAESRQTGDAQAALRRVRR